MLSVSDKRNTYFSFLFKRSIQHCAWFFTFTTPLYKYIMNLKFHSRIFSTLISRKSRPPWVSPSDGSSTSEGKGGVKSTATTSNGSLHQEVQEKYEPKILSIYKVRVLFKFNDNNAKVTLLTLNSIVVTISYNSYHYLIPVMMISK